MSSMIERKCMEKGVRLTDQRKLIAKVMSEADDHPDVDELHKRVNKIGNGAKLEKFEFEKLPKYIQENKKKFERWLD